LTSHFPVMPSCRMRGAIPLFSPVCVCDVDRYNFIKKQKNMT
jgi:hypothetical protein